MERGHRENAEEDGGMGGGSERDHCTSGAHNIFSLDG